MRTLFLYMVFAYQKSIVRCKKNISKYKNCFLIDIILLHIASIYGSMIQSCMMCFGRERSNLCMFADAIHAPSGDKDFTASKQICSV